MHQLGPSLTLFKAAGPLRGSIRVPGDKSISHRSLMLAGVAEGTSRIEGLLEGEDVLATAAALRAMGVDVARLGDGRWTVNGSGLAGLRAPPAPLDMGNSGTSTRLLMGLLAGRPISARMEGDASLSRRPMGRVISPLATMGAEVQASDGGRLPLTIQGAARPRPIDYRLPVASAQVKSAVLLAGLSAAGTTRVIEPEPTRDHSERMLAGFGADLSVEETDGVRTIAITGGRPLAACDIVVPGDPSSAAFFAVAALIVPGSDLLIEHVGVNRTRAGLFALLQAMGGDIAFENGREIGGEPVADLRVRASQLAGFDDVPPRMAASMIDEFPILFVAAALARGRTTARGLTELRVKESDRLTLTARGLRALGVAVEELEDGLVIDGRDGEPFAPPEPPTIAAELDHRIAMSFAVAGLRARDGVRIDDMAPVATSFPGFADALRRTGAIA